MLATTATTPPPTSPSKHGFDFQAWAAHGVPFLSRAEEAGIQQRVVDRQDAAAAAAAATAKEEAESSEIAKGPKEEAESSEIAKGPKEERPPHVARDGTTLATLPLHEQNLILDARKKVFLIANIISAIYYGGT